MRMFVGGRGKLVRLLAMFVGRVGVLLGLFVLTKIMMVGGLMMMRGRDWSLPDGRRGWSCPCGHSRRWSSIPTPA